MRLYVGNLAFHTTEDQLQAAFERFGSVNEVKVMIDQGTGRSRGFAFVTMGSTTEGNAAISGLEGQDLDGRNLTVNEARPREDRGNGGGNGSWGNRSKRSSSTARRY